MGNSNKSDEIKLAKEYLNNNDMISYHELMLIQKPLFNIEFDQSVISLFSWEVSKIVYDKSMDIDHLSFILVEKASLAEINSFFQKMKVKNLDLDQEYFDCLKGITTIREHMRCISIYYMSLIFAFKSYGLFYALRVDDIKYIKIIKRNSLSKKYKIGYNFNRLRRKLKIPYSENVNNPPFDDIQNGLLKSVEPIIRDIFIKYKFPIIKKGKDGLSGERMMLNDFLDNKKFRNKVGSKYCDGLKYLLIDRNTINIRNHENHNWDSNFGEFPFTSYSLITIIFSLLYVYTKIK